MVELDRKTSREKSREGLTWQTNSRDCLGTGMTPVVPMVPDRLTHALADVVEALSFRLGNTTTRYGISDGRNDEKKKAEPRRKHKLWQTKRASENGENLASAVVPCPSHIITRQASSCTCV